MSLKSFHVVFITAAFLLCVFLGGWSLFQYFTHGRQASDLAMGFVGVVGSAACVVYGRYFLRKLKNIEYF